MERILKAAQLERADVAAEDLTLINAQALRPLTAEEVYVFRLAACDDQVDRDNERFPRETLENFAALFVGRPVLRDHRWSADTQTARIYAAGVEDTEQGCRLVLRCYMPRLETNKDTIAAIESGILRECSVGVAVEGAVCSICGKNQRESLCRHIPGREYGGKRCHMDLVGAKDAYEASMVAVPSQPLAGVVKSKRYGEPAAEEPGEAPEETGISWQDEALLEMEKSRFDDGGMQHETETH